MEIRATPHPLEIMLRIHMLQNLYDFSDMGAKYEVIDSRAFLKFCGVESSNQVPDGDTIGWFRALLVERGLQERLYRQVLELLQARGLLLKKGTIMDSTIIAAPPSTKNHEKKRDPDACQTKKGNTRHFGYKAHIGVDQDTGLVHHLEVTAANVHDVVVTQSCSPARKRMSTAIQRILALRNARMLLYITTRARKSAIKSIADPRSVKTIPCVQSGGSEKNLPFGLRSSMFSESSRGCLGIARHDTKADENRTQNFI